MAYRADMANTLQVNMNGYTKFFENSLNTFKVYYLTLKNAKKHEQ